VIGMKGMWLAVTNGRFRTLRSANCGVTPKAAPLPKNVGEIGLTIPLRPMILLMDERLRSSGYVRIDETRVQVFEQR
jgi:hypothetical protein